MLGVSEWAADMRRIAIDKLGMKPNTEATPEQLFELQARCRVLFEARTGLSWTQTRRANRGVGHSPGSPTRFLKGDDELRSRGLGEAMALDRKINGHEHVMAAMRAAGNVTDVLPGTDGVADSVPLRWVVWREVVAEYGDVWLPPQMCAMFPQLLIPWDPDTAVLRRARVIAAGITFTGKGPVFYLDKISMKLLFEKYHFRCTIIKAFLDAGRPLVMFRPKPIAPATSPSPVDSFTRDLSPLSPVAFEPAAPEPPAQLAESAPPPVSRGKGPLVIKRPVARRPVPRRKIAPFYPEQRAKRRREQSQLDFARAPFEAMAREIAGDYRWEANALQVVQFATEQRLLELFEDAYFLTEKIGKRMTLMEIDMQAARRLNHSEI